MLPLLDPTTWLRLIVHNIMCFLYLLLTKTRGAQQFVDTQLCIFEFILNRLARFCAIDNRYRVLCTSKQSVHAEHTLRTVHITHLVHPVHTYEHT